MSWIEVVAYFDRAPEDWSPFVDVFGQFGCENTIQTDTPPTLGAAVVEVDGAGQVVENLKAALLAMGASRVESRPLVEDNWEENWKRFFKPRRVGKRFIVRPTWEDFAGEPGDLEIVLDPGQAFGTGDHPTTRMCLELLDEFLKPNQTVADIGCGSGILSVGAVKLGAKRVVAIDIDPLSVEVSKENAQLNQVEFEAITGVGVQSLPPASSESNAYDLVVSNIISATLISIAREIALVVRPKGHWIVSGIIEANWPDVLEAAQRAGFRLERLIQEDDWIGAALIKAA